MAFVPKEWKDRLVEFAGRRKLTNVSTGEEIIVDVVRNEGTVSQEGDAFSGANMSDLEQRVADEFNNINTNLGGLKFYEDSDGNKYVVGADSVPKKLGSVELNQVSVYAYNGGAESTGTSIVKSITVSKGSYLVIAFGCWSSYTEHSQIYGVTPKFSVTNGTIIEEDKNKCIIEITEESGSITVSVMNNYYLYSAFAIISL